MMYIGKIAVSFILCSIPDIAESQIILEDSFNYHIPTFIKGDTQLFQISNNTLQSNSGNTSAHQYLIYVDSIPAADSLLFEFKLELQLNTSSVNQFTFGIQHLDSSKSFFVIGNSKDQLEFKSTRKDSLLGDPGFFNKSKTQLQVYFFYSRKKIRLQLFNLEKPEAMNFEIETYEFKDISRFYWQINQSGKSAMGTHRISNFKMMKLPKGNTDFRLKECKKITHQQWLLTFTENLFIPEKQQIKINDLNPDSILFLPFNHHQILIHSKLFESDTFKWQLYVQNRYLENLDTQFTILIKRIPQPKWSDVKINEVFFDKTPNYGNLPGVTYVELRKIKKGPILLSNSQIRVNQKNFTLPNIVWDQPEFLIICSDSNYFKGEFCIQLNLNLLVSKNVIGLLNSNNEWLDSVEVSTKNQHYLFDDGGVSIESINESAPFTPTHLWFSNAHLGGTPGKPNDPLPLNLKKPNPHEIIGLVADQNSWHFTVSETLKPQQWMYVNDSQDSIWYDLQGEISIPNSKNHPENNPIKLKYINRWGVLKIEEITPVTVGNTPIEITEIWFESPRNTDFIEIYNAGNQAIRIEDLDFIIYDEHSLIQKVVPLADSKRKWFFPGEYLVFTNNRLSIIQNFDAISPHQVIEITPFPNLSSTGGFIEIVHHLFGRMDKAPFQQEMHTQLNPEGVSLEKRMLGLYSSNPESWMSHLGISSKGSPTVGKEMIQQSELKKPIIMNQRTFFYSPTLTSIDVQFDFPLDGYYLHGYLFDSWGNPITYLLKGVQLPQKGIYPILLDNLSKKLALGNYVIKFEARHDQHSKVFYQTERITLLNE